jgi:hypothetical protein
MPVKNNNMNKPSAFGQSDLTSSLCSIARKQNLLSAVPPALRLVPLAAFAAGDLYERRYGQNPLDGLLSAAEGGRIDTGAALELRVVATRAAAHVSHASTIPSSCATCSRRGLDAFLKVKVNCGGGGGSSSPWQSSGFRFYERWRWTQMASSPAADGVGSERSRGLD